jgi:hypothetical protein
MPLQNRVNPFGELFDDSSRGLFMGNRGGRFHRGDQTLGAKRFASKQWICCQLQFKNRQRKVWSTGYTELFFLDEVTALAAGHRPCFECRREDATLFAACWMQAFKLPAPPRVADMDVVLHAERLDNDTKRRHRRALETLPDGALIALDDDAFAVRGDTLLRWQPSGYGEPRPRGTGMVEVLTPPATLAVLAAGYRPKWHCDAEPRP